MPIRLLIVESQPATCHGIGRFVEGRDIAICAEEASLDSLCDRVRQAGPDLVLLARRLGGRNSADGDGMDGLRELRQLFPELPVIILAEVDYSSDLAIAHELGAVGYLPKSVGREQFVTAIHAAAGGRTLWSRADIRRITGATSAARIDVDSDVPLTPRELEILHSISQGRTNRKIGEQLGISPETVKEHVQHMLTKIGVQDRTQAAVWAVRAGIV